MDAVMNKQVFTRIAHADICASLEFPNSTEIPDEVFSKISDLKSLGIYAYVLTFPKSEIFTPGRLAEASRDGADSTMAGIRDLVRLGWMQQAIVPKNFGWVYILQALETLKPAYKIGKAEDPWQRYVEWQLASPVPLDVVKFIPSGDMGRLELSLHKKYESKQLCFNGKRGEWFALSLKEVEEIKSMEAML